jgi:hypothetical protein
MGDDIRSKEMKNGSFGPAAECLLMRACIATLLLKIIHHSEFLVVGFARYRVL